MEVEAIEILRNGEWIRSKASEVKERDRVKMFYVNGDVEEVRASCDAYQDDDLYNSKKEWVIESAD